jgi:RimJ/RimL family protein N-acetyltransferase
MANGHALLDSLLIWARTNPNAQKVELLVRSTNAPAVSLYHRCGFVEEGRLRARVRLRNGQFIDDLSMALHLHQNAG